MKQVQKLKMMNNFFTEILDFIYKKKCIICHSKKENSFLCTNCKSEILFNDYKVIKRIDNIDVYSCCNYSGIPQKLVRLLKFHNKRFLSKEIANLIFKYISELNSDFSDYEIICVPLHKNKQKKRGFNQCELISKDLSELLKIPYNFNIIKRIKNTKSMYNLKYAQRIENLKKAFSVDKSSYNGKNLLIIDDIVTTGTTLTEMIKELKKSGIEKMTCLTFTNTDKSSINIK